MKGIISTIVACICLLGLQAQPDTSKPVITFKYLTYNFGTIPKGSRTCTFPFTNTGTGDLIIAHCVSSCGCITVDWPKEVFGPGDGGEIKASFYGSHAGPFAKNVTVTSNSVKDTVLILTLKGEVFDSNRCPLISFDDLVVDIGTVKRKANSTMPITFRFQNTGNEDLIVATVKYGGGKGYPDYANLSEPLAPGEWGYVTIHFMLDYVGQFNKQCTINSNAANLPLLIFSIKGNIVE